METGGLLEEAMRAQQQTEAAHGVGGPDDDGFSSIESGLEGVGQGALGERFRSMVQPLVQELMTFPETYVALANILAGMSSVNRAQLTIARSDHARAMETTVDHWQAGAEQETHEGYGTEGDADLEHHPLHRLLAPLQFHNHA